MEAVSAVVLGVWREDVVGAVEAEAEAEAEDVVGAGVDAEAGVGDVVVVVDLEELGSGCLETCRKGLQ